ncbi:hypothetical protein [Ignatzschineria cameli]|uniref:hypothetical protein n=1 Tax=Ignatzschineria cameli TaxID=2182793 RepID=UPI001057F25D|nr:hypothetical protein [Ignatzschineria cameli]
MAIIRLPEYYCPLLKLVSCRSLLSRSSTNSAPADSIRDTDWRACSSDKSVIVGSRRSMNLFKNHSSNYSSKEKRLNAAGPYYRVLP